MNDLGKATRPVESSSVSGGDTSTQVGGAMLFRILDLADVIQERSSQALSRIDLSYPKYEVLKHLHEAGEPITLGALAEGQSCARSNITQLVDRLEADGLVRRVADPDDRRSIRAELTTLGQARALEGKVEMQQVVAAFEGRLSEDERAQLVQLLEKMG
jgi:DNA-binding MarR family transcriptional regulator